MKSLRLLGLASLALCDAFEVCLFFYLYIIVKTSFDVYFERERVCVSVGGGERQRERERRRERIPSRLHALCSAQSPDVGLILPAERS